MAAVEIEPVDVLGLRLSGIFLQRMRFDVEHLRYGGPLPDVRPSMAMDVVPQMRRMVTA